MGKIAERIEARLGHFSTWIVGAGIVAAVIFAGPPFVESLKSDDPQEQPAPPPVESDEKPKAEEESNNEPAPEPPPRASDPGIIDRLYEFLVDEGGYPSQVDAVQVPIPPNGPDDVTVAIEQAQATNRELVPDAEPSMVNAVTSCVAAEMWRREGDWGTAAEQLKARRFDEANLTCIGIAREVASNAPPSGTSYVNIPEAIPAG